MDKLTPCCVCELLAGRTCEHHAWNGHTYCEEHQYIGEIMAEMRDPVHFVAPEMLRRYVRGIQLG